MEIGIYDPYLDTLSGGEKYMLTAAACLLVDNKVTIFWDDQTILDQARKKLHIDLSGVTIKKNIFAAKFSALKRLNETRKYDRLIILSDGSLPLTLARKTILHFQFPVEWVKSDRLEAKIKLMKISKVVCNSIFTKTFIDKKFHIRSTVLYPPCVTLEDIRKNSDRSLLAEKENIILTVGRFSPLPDGSSIKKLEIMIKAFKEMIDAGLIKWKFIAAISFLEENENLAHNLQDSIKNYPIKILNNINYNDLNKLYRSAKIYWHAAGFGEDLEKHPERAEHFGITTVEAMTHKVVPVAYARGGQPEIVDDNINGFLWETEAELIAKTKKIMIDDKLRRQMANLGLKKIEQFSLEKFCRDLQEIIK